MLRILYFGRLREELGCEAETLDWADGGNTQALLMVLRQRSPQHALALAPGRVFRLVINRQIVQEDVLVPDGSEVGVLPPVTGG